jgi:hypothetical protein
MICAVLGCVLSLRPLGRCKKQDKMAGLQGIYVEVSEYGR